MPNENTGKSKRVSRGAAWIRYLKRRASRALDEGIHGKEVDNLKAEIELLTSYSTDTAYRLRYDTMEYEYVSPSILRLLGYSPAEFCALNLRSLIKKTRLINNGVHDVESFNSLEEDRKDGTTEKWQADYLVRNKEGKHVWISDISYPWFDGDGNIIGSVGTLRDINDRVQAEARADDERQKHAHQDTMTGFCTRKYFFERIDQEIKRSKRSKQPLSMLLIDIDHFRRINTSYGHETGDDVIRGITAIISACLRETDIAGRAGGEEFAILLPETSQQGAYWVAERIRSSVEKKKFITRQGNEVQVTVSIGASDLSHSKDINASELYRVADSRLFIAKHTGRNQVSMDEISVMH